MPQLREHSMQAVGTHSLVVAVELIAHLLVINHFSHIFIAASRHDFRIWSDSFWSFTARDSITPPTH
jgi:hypothetical protein